MPSRGARVDEDRDVEVPSSEGEEDGPGPP